MLKIKNLVKSFTNEVIFKDFSMELEENKITCILGVSGIGKTTLLNIITGLISFDSGDLSDFKNKTFSYIFQEPRLLEWKTVFGNISFVLKDKYAKRDILSITEKYIKLVELENFKNYYPSALSSGMEQRVSIARAFAFPSDILIMDEPFKSLDYKLKKLLIKAFIDLWKTDKRTVLFVTHDIEEASYLSNNIFILKETKPTNIVKTLKFNINLNDRLSDYNNIRLIKKEITSSF